MQFLNYMCGFKLLLKVLRIHWSKRPHHTSSFGYEGLNTIKNYKTVSPKLVRVVYERCSFSRILIVKLCLGKLWCFGSVVAYWSWCHGGSNVWNQNKPLLQRNPDMTIIVEYVKQDPDIGHFTVPLESGQVFSRIALWDCLGDEDRPNLNRTFSHAVIAVILVFRNNERRPCFCTKTILSWTLFLCKRFFFFVPLN